MRVDVKKFLFVGTEAFKNLFFEKAQAAGIIHFIDTKKVRETSKKLDVLLHAIKILRGLPVLAQNEMTDMEEALPLAEEIVKIKQRIDTLQEEERLLKLEMARVHIFGDFSIEDLRYIEEKGRRPVFYTAKKGKLAALPEEVLYIDSDHGLDYFLGFLKGDAPIEGLIEMKIDRSLGELKARKLEVHAELAALEAKLKECAKEKAFLHCALTHHLNGHYLESAKKSSAEPIDEKLFAACGWVSSNKENALMQLVEEMHVHVEEIAVDENETVPTFLENKGSLSLMGEDLVHIYDTPGPTDRDPSLFVLIAFSLFFAMIIGDAGYGLILLLVSLWLKYFKFPNASKLGKRVLNLTLVLFSSCIVWGLLTTSFFGMSIPADNPIRKLSLTNYLAEKKIHYHFSMQDAFHTDTIKKFPGVEGLTHPHEIFRSAVKKIGDEIEYVLLDKTTQGLMVELALLIGVIHILSSLIRYMDRNYAAFGWSLFVIGAYLYIPEYLGECTMMHYLCHFDHSTLQQAGIALMGSGMFLAVAAGIYVNKLLGILEVMTVIQIFADILSYLRLYALGLAGGIVSATVNGFASSAFFLVGIVILLVGHLINIALAVMGGVIHGLRLNFLEWYHYSFYGGGKPFKPLKKIDIE